MSTMYAVQRYRNDDFDSLVFFEDRSDMEEYIVAEIANHNKTASDTDCMLKELPEDYRFTDGYFEHEEWRIWASGLAFVKEHCATEEVDAEIKSVVIGVDHGGPEGSFSGITVIDSQRRPTERCVDWPWMIVLDLEPEEIPRVNNLTELGDFRLSIRRMEDGRLFADMPNEPITIPEKCAEVLERTQIIVREAGPASSDFERLYFWDAERYRRLMMKDVFPGADAGQLLSKDISKLLSVMKRGEFPK